MRRPRLEVDDAVTLATVVIRRVGDDKLSVEAQANGVDRATLAAILRDLAERWEVENGQPDS